MVVIVEGTNDERKIINAGIKTDIIVTHGTRMNNRIKSIIDSYLNQGKTLYILSDPDEAGDHLCNMIQSQYPFIERIIVEPDESKYWTGKKFRYGIEWCSSEYLQKLLTKI